MYKIKVTNEFEKDYNKLDKSIKTKIDGEIEKLKENPYSSKPLGYQYFREKKIDNYRIYFLVFREEVIVFVIALSSKKDQQPTIDKIKKLIPDYQKEIREKYSNDH